MRQGNVFTPVCHSVHREAGCLPEEGCLPGGGVVDTPPPCGQNDRMRRACWDTVNKRVVRILLECILIA